MTKYKEMPPNTIVKPGDRLTVTITVPESGGLTVRPGIDDVKLIERPIPEVELPTVPGYYEAAGLPMSRGYAPYELQSNGQWCCNGYRVSESRMREITPLTRLVPETESAPAKLAGRLDVEKMIELLKYLEAGMGTWRDNAADIIDAIDNGELDK